MSHAHADNAKCDPYVKALIQRGVSLYYDRSNPQVGHDLGVALEREIQRANALIVMVTPASLRSFWVTEEISMFFSLMAQDPSRLLIPIKLEPCQLPPRLASRWWIDATNQSLGEVLDQLADALETPAIPLAPLPSKVHTPIANVPESIPFPSESESVPPSGKRISRRAVITTGAASAAAIGAGVIWWVRSNGVSAGFFAPRPTATPTLPFAFRGHKYDVWSLAWSPNSKRIASGGWDATTQVFDATDGQHRFVYRGPAYEVFSVGWSPNGSRIVSAYNDGEIRVWDATNGGHALSYGGHKSTANSVAWSPNGEYVASGSDDKTVQVWDATDGSTAFTYTGHSDIVRSVAWSHDGKRIASCSVDNTAQVWDAFDGRHAFTFRGHRDPIYAVAWSPNEQRIATGGFDKTVQVWNAADGGNLFVYRGHSNYVMSITWSPQGDRICSGDSPISFEGVGTVQVWDAADGGHLYIYHGHSAGVNCVVWSPDGSLIASASSDQTVQVWRPQ